ncbi:MAG TPA: hypothetical protein ENI85_15600 [Deltaproteobacteria bacterium]|nr:hypothetical protein [Deltaproteobacteria bacterium]
MDDFSNDTAVWLADRVGRGSEVELDIGVLVAAASEWTEDETELDDLVSGLVECGRIRVGIG